MASSNSSPSNLIVNYLPQQMTDKQLHSLFSTIGLVKELKIMRDYKTGYSYGYGFVHFNRPEDAELAIKQLNGQEVFNKRIKVSYARPPGDDIKETNLYITNLPRNYTEEDLERIFGPYGTIVNKNLLFDKITGAQRGVAFVRYDRREEAQKAIQNLNGHTPEGGKDPLNVRIAEEHGKQKAASFTGWQPEMPQGRGRGDSFRGMRGFNPRGNSRPMMLQGRNSGMRGGSDYPSNDNLVSYPIRAPNNMVGGFGPLRQDKLQQRYSPWISGTPNSYSSF